MKVRYVLVSLPHSPALQKLHVGGLPMFIHLSPAHLSVCVRVSGSFRFRRRPNQFAQFAQQKQIQNGQGLFGVTAQGFPSGIEK